MANNPGQPEKGTQSVPLRGFFGWVTDAAPENLPEGLSPDNGNADYSVGSVFQRDGVQNVFSFLGESTGPNPPVSGTDLPVGSIAWQNPGNITHLDGAYSTLSFQTIFNVTKLPTIVTQSAPGAAWTNPNNIVSPTLFATVTPTPVTQTLVADNAGFSLPLDATVTGLQLNYKIGSSVGGSTANVSFSYSGSAYGSQAPFTVPTAVTPMQLGGPGNLLGLNPTPAIVNDPSFGAQFQVTAASGASAQLYQSWGATSYLSATLASTSPFPVRAGDAIVVSLNVFDMVFLGVSDNQGNAYTLVNSVANGSYLELMYYVIPASSGLLTITATCAAANFNSFMTFNACEFGGFASPVSVDAHASNTGRSDPFNTGTVTTTNQYDTVFTQEVGTNGSTLPTITPGYTAGASVPFGPIDGIGLVNMSSAFLNVLSTGTFSPSWGIHGWGSQSGTGLTAAFRLANALISAGGATITVYYTIPGTADTLRASNFNFAINPDAVLGVEIGVTGHITGTGTAQAILTDGSGNPIGNPKTFTFTAGDTRIPLGSSTDTWGAVLNSVIINNNNFGVNIINANGTGATEWFVDFVDATVWQNPGSQKFNWAKTYKRTTGSYNLATTVDGTLWLEDLQLSPNELSNVYSELLPDSHPNSTTHDNREFIALSDLSEGYDMPRQFNITGTATAGSPPTTTAQTQLDRVSQCGPAFSPAVSFSSTSYAIEASPLGLTQPAPITMQPPGFFRPWYVISSGIGSTAPGSLLQIIFQPSILLPADVELGDNVVLTGFPVVNGQNINSGVGTNPAFYTLSYVGQPIQGVSWYTALAFTVPANTYANARPDGAVIQQTKSTMATSVSVPNLEVGGQFTILGATNSAWNGSYTVQASANASELSITETSLSIGIATYAYTLVNGAVPTAGEQVTVTNCNNGNGIFNGINLTIASATPSNFTVNIAAPNVSSAAESGSAVVSGTSFVFDPLKVISNSGGGTVVVGGANSLTSGQRKAVVLYETRNGFITAPGPYFQFNTTTGVTTLTFSNILPGGPEILSRIVAVTPADSGSFYYLPEPVTVATGGINTTYPSFVIQDNTSTSVTLQFTDDVLTGGTRIDVPGNNLFNIVELGNVLGMISYKNRILAWGEESKVQNFQASLSFNGGVATQSSQGGGGTTSQTSPAGWTIAPAVAGSPPTIMVAGTVVVSPAYGLSFQVSNTSGATQPVIGMISQPAYQDQNNVAIIDNNIKYGVRAVASCPTTSASGDIVIDLYDPAVSRVYGEFSIPLASLSETLTRNVGDLLTSPFGVGNVPSVPSTLELRVWGRNIPDGVTWLLDRFEVYDTGDPVNTSLVRVSYAGNPEAFDSATGQLDISGFTAEPIRNVYVDRDIVYICTPSARYQTQDNGVGEPGGEGGWTIRQTTEISGSCSVNGTAAGEEWRISANETGLFIYWGGEPIPIMQEIQQVWNCANWDAETSVVCCNDPEQRRLLVALPMPTGPGTKSHENGYFLTAPADPNPTTPNIVLAMSYRQLSTGQHIADSPSIHITFTGKVTARELSRKWTWWSIPCSYVTQILRPDGTNQTVYCSNSVPKIYQQVKGSTDDDGAAINSYYITYGFVSDDAAAGLRLTELRRIYLFMTMIVSGTGQFNVTTINNYLDSGESTVLLPFSLFMNPAFDLECPLQEEANRLFIRFGCNSVGSTFSMSRILMTLRKAPSTVVTGLEQQGT